jgi:hypothetical protein
MASAAAQYSRPLQRKLQEAGLQGCVDAAAFKRLLQYAEDVQGSLDKVHQILAVLKTSAFWRGPWRYPGARLSSLLWSAANRLCTEMSAAVVARCPPALTIAHTQARMRMQPHMPK